MIPEPVTLDTYEAITDYARELSQDLDQKRWALGDCANLVQSRYGDKTIDSFARDIGQRKSTIYQYAKVALYYPKILRGRISEEMPNINYSHMRDAMRCSDDFNDAWDWLKECSDNGWSADESSRRLTEQLGHETRDNFEGLVSSGSLLMNGHRYIEILVYNDDEHIKIETGATVIIRPK